MKRVLTEEEKRFVWNKWYGDLAKTKDPYGVEIDINTCQFDHVCPYDICKETKIENMMPISKDANEAKSDHTTWSYRANDFEVVRKINKDGVTVGILKIGKKEISPLNEYRNL